MSEPRFNWVEACEKCRPQYVFNALAERVERDVADFNALDERHACQFVRTPGEPGFQVQRLLEYPNSPKSVGFKLKGSQIVVETEGVILPLEGRPTLQFDGRCLVEAEDQAPMELWQFSRFALEPLFFPQD